MTNLKTDVSGINRKLQSISSVLEVLVGNKQDCPRLIIVLPKDGNRYLQMLKNPVDVALFKSSMIVKFVCPITYKVIDDYEVEIKDAREFVKKYGPILLISIRILQVGMTVGKLLGLPLPSADLFPVSELKSIMALNNSNNVHDKLTTLALNKMSDVINQQIDQSLKTFSTQLDPFLNPTEDGFNNMQINKSLQTITDANYKEFHKLLTKNYTMDLANELRGKMSRLCGGDGFVEWVSIAGEDEWYNKHGRLDDPTTTTAKGVITSSMAAPIDDIKSWLVDKLVAKKMSKENADDACNKLISQDITTADIFIGCDESDMTKDFLKQIGISTVGIRSAILDIHKNERSMLGHTSDDKSPSDNKKSYADAERVLKLEAELEMMKKRVPIHDDKIKTRNYNVSVDVGNGQQQLKQNQKEQYLNSPNQQMNDDADELAQRMEKMEKEVYGNQEAFKIIHEEIEKIHEDRRGSSPSRSDQGMQQTNVNNNAAQCCTVS
jgi:hypothetical protein